MAKRHAWTIVQGECRSGVRIGNDFIRMTADQAHTLLCMVETDDSAAMVAVKATAVLEGARNVLVLNLEPAGVL